MLCPQLDPNPEDAPLHSDIECHRPFHSTRCTWDSTLPRMRYTDAIKREGESIGRWCRRYVGISRRDERRSQFCFHQCVGQRSNLLAQLFEKVVNKRVGRPTTGIIAKW